YTLFHAEIAPPDAAMLEEAQRQEQNGNLSYAHETSSGADAIAAAGAGSTAGAAALGTGGATSTMPRQVVASDRDKIGRNDPCWGGSGQKINKCHGP